MRSLNLIHSSIGILDNVLWRR